MTTRSDSATEALEWPSKAETDTYRILRNDEEQYAVWPTSKCVPHRWTDTGFEGTQQQCSQYLAASWTHAASAFVRRQLTVK